MAKARLAKLASDELDDIWLYIASDNMDAADRTASKILGAINAIARRPGIGRLRDEVMAGLRSWPVGAYVIYYVLSADKRYVDIVHVAHGARSTERLFGSDKEQ